ncbi:hypothetical protein AK812_SmicGene15708 [Symbiodinium microadriaticum]|uniref:Uncharacterized protein n=1 Tax=Symbiodinium microadriaticum TaxID=2951 RepID=A0A1Q9E293_SYMMI|nr:hypothetical protein AK812_SmicGene15708 [Symbiodinium microadriaticum]
MPAPALQHVFQATRRRRSFEKRSSVIGLWRRCWAGRRREGRPLSNATRKLGQMPHAGPAPKSRRFEESRVQEDVQVAVYSDPVLGDDFHGVHHSPVVVSPVHTAISSGRGVLTEFSHLA